MDRINEIGDTPKGQYALGQVYARANKRLGDLTDAWTKQMPKKKYYTAAEYYPKGQKKYADIMHDAKAEAECPPNRKVNMKPVVYNDKGYETTNFGLGARDYEKTHKTNENNQYTNMNKKQIRLTESDLHRIVKESVKRIVKESHNNKILDALYALQIALNDVLESCSSKTSRINQWATRVSQEADEIVNKYETQLNSYDSDPYKKMGRMDTAI